MSQPNLDEMDALMGESGGPRGRTSHDRIVDAETVVPSIKTRKVKKAPNRGLVLGLAGAGIVAAVLGATYLLIGRQPSAIVASPEVIAATLGGNTPNFSVQSSPPQDAIPMQPSLTLDAESEAAPSPGAGPEVDELDPTAPAAAAAPALEATGASAVADTLSPNPALQSRVDALTAELEAAHAAKAAAEKALAEARSKAPEPRVVTRDANTSFVLVETLIDGAVLRDRAGNEIIVPRGGSVQVAGNRLSIGSGG